MIFKKSIRIMFMMILVSAFIFQKFQALAQDNYPNRYIQVVVPWAAGSPTDLTIRFLADKWAEFLGQPLIVANKVGAGGVLGTKYVAHAKPDGYTILALTESAAISSRLEQKDPGFDLDSFRCLFIFSQLVSFFTVKSDSKWKTMDEFLSEAKNNPKKYKYGTVGARSALVMTVDMLSKLAGVKLTLVPFKSGPDCLTAVAGGNIDMALTWGLSGLGGSGMIRPVAVASEERVSDYPDVPTLKELGYPVKHTSSYNGVAAPIKTPERVISKIIEAHNKVWTKYTKEIKDTFTKMNQYPIYIEEKSAMEQLKGKEKSFREFYQQIGFKPE